MRTITLFTTTIALCILPGCGDKDDPSNDDGGEPVEDSEDDIGGDIGDDNDDDDDDTDVGSELEGTLLSDLGFRPEPDGYSFPNYTNADGALNLDTKRMRNLMGPGVCSETLSSCTADDEAEGYCMDSCVLTPQARAWMDKTNTAMGGGHCYGMAVSSELVFEGNIGIDAYDTSASATFEAERTDGVERFVAVWWATQKLIDTSQTYSSSANDVVSYLMDHFDAGEAMTLAVWGDVSGGHAVTPFAIAELEDGTQRIYVYDNNHPGEARYVEVDPEANTYSYVDGSWSSSTAGGHNMRVDPLYLQSDILNDDKQFYDCTFCETGSSSISLLIEGDNEVSIQDVGGDNTVIGRGISWDLSALEDAAVNAVVKGIEEQPIPHLSLPATTAYAFAHTAETLEATHLTLSGDGVVSEIEGMVGEAAEAFISEDGHSLRYLSSGDEKVTLSIATHHDDADYSFSLDVGGSADMLAQFDVNEKLEQLEITLLNGSVEHELELRLERHADDLADIATFPTNWHAEDVVYIVRYGDWAGGDAELDVEIVMEDKDETGSDM